MDKLIIAIINPFALKHKITVYNAEGQIIKTVQSTMKDLGTTIYALSTEYEVDNIKLLGSKVFGSRIKDQFLANKFGIKNFNIEVE